MRLNVENAILGLICPHVGQKTGGPELPSTLPGIFRMIISSDALNKAVSKQIFFV